jgi:hypothetical protein
VLGALDGAFVAAGRLLQTTTLYHSLYLLDVMRFSHEDMRLRVALRLDENERFSQSNNVVESNRCAGGSELRGGQ